MDEDKVPQKQTSDTQTPSVPHVTEKPQKAIRTYESDVADVLAHKNISTTNIALAEQKRSLGENRIGNSVESKDEKDGNSKNTKKILILLASLLLIVVGLAAGYYFYSLSPLSNTKSTVPQNTTKPSSIIPADTQVIISINNLNTNGIIDSVRKEISKQQNPDTIKEIIFTQTINDQTTRIDGPSIAKIMDIPAPDSLLRVLSPDWMLGVYEDQQGTKDVFVIATINYFQNAFAGMLQWENTMADDLKIYLSTQTIAGIAASPEIPLTTSTTSTSSATSTFETSYQNYLTNDIIRGSFTDKIVKNKDVREFVTSNGPLFLYSFIDETKLVVTGKESTLSQIISRLEQNAYIR